MASAMFPLTLCRLCLFLLLLWAITSATGNTSLDLDPAIDYCELPAVANASAVSSFIPVGDNVTYTCNSGFYIEGDEMITCDGNNTLSNPPPECKVSACPPRVLSLAVGVATLQSTQEYGEQFHIGSSITYQCNHGHVVASANHHRVVSTCLPGGSWDSAVPTCTVKFCPQRSLVLANGKVDSTSDDQEYATGSKLNYTCDEGYRVTGFELLDTSSIVATCSPSLTWDQPVPTCSPSWQSLDRSLVVVNNKPLTKAEAETACEQRGARLVQLDAPQNNEKFASLVRKGMISSTFWIRLDQSGGNYTWTQSDTANLAFTNWAAGQPSNLGSNACTVFSGRAWRSANCNNTFPSVCERVNATVCQRRDIVVPYGKVSVDQSQPRVSVTYQCDPSFFITGTNRQSSVVVQCLEDGEWTAPVPSCSYFGSQCAPRDTALQYGTVTVDQATSNVSLTYECNPSHRINGTSAETSIVAQCSADGQWTAPEPTCSLVTCRTLSSTFTNGQVIGNATSATPGTGITFQCDYGYHIQDSVTTETVRRSNCSDEGDWSATTPTCTLTLCPRRSQVLANGIVNFTYIGQAYTIGSKLHYTCAPGFRLAGFESLGASSIVATCTAGQTWDQPEPTCSPRWYSFNNGLVVYNSQPLTKAAAQAACQQRGARLVQLDAQKTNNLFARLIQHGIVKTFWVGLDQTAEGNFSWVQPAGANLAFTNWATGQPSDPESNACAVFAGSAWRSENCGNTFPSVCERVNTKQCSHRDASIQFGSVSLNETTTGISLTYQCNPSYVITGTAAQTSVVVQCSADGKWSARVPTCTPNCIHPFVDGGDGSCVAVLFQPSGHTSLDAIDACQQEGGVLGRVDSKEKIRYIRQQLNRYPREINTVLIGLTVQRTPPQRVWRFSPPGVSPIFVNDSLLRTKGVPPVDKLCASVSKYGIEHIHCNKTGQAIFCERDPSIVTGAAEVPSRARSAAAAVGGVIGSLIVVALVYVLVVSQGRRRNSPAGIPTTTKRPSLFRGIHQFNRRFAYTPYSNRSPKSMLKFEKYFQQRSGGRGNGGCNKSGPPSSECSPIRNDVQRQAKRNGMYIVSPTARQFKTISTDAQEEFDPKYLDFDTSALHTVQAYGMASQSGSQIIAIEQKPEEES